MRICLLPGLFLFLCLGQSGEAEERPPIYPFDVTTGDETAVLEGSVTTAIFAGLKKPVAKNAAVKLGFEEPTMNIVVRELGTSRVLFEVSGKAASPGTTTTTTKPKVDSSDPAAVLQAVFDSARSGDHSQLATLGSSGPDGDVQMILGVPKGDEKIKTMFVTFFGKGKVVGTPRIQGDKAEVDFLFGPDGKKPETMNLIKEGGQWRLHSF